MFKKLKDLLAEQVGSIVPERKYFSGEGSIKDPFSGKKIIAPSDPAGLLHSSDGYLYTPLKSGYQRTKTTIVRPVSNPSKIDSSDDTAVRTGSSSYPEGVRIYSAYQDSGGALDLSIGNVGKTIIVYTQTIPNATLTMFDYPELLFGSGLYHWWSAAAGANQYLNVQYYEDVQIEDV